MQLQKDMFIESMKHAHPSDLPSMCKVSKYYSNLCKDQDIWKQLYLHHFGPLKMDVSDWKSHYLDALKPSGMWKITLKEDYVTVGIFPRVKKIVNVFHIERNKSYEYIIYVSEKTDPTAKLTPFLQIERIQQLNNYELDILKERLEKENAVFEKWALHK